MATEKRSLLTEVPQVGVYPDIETFKKLEPARQKKTNEQLAGELASNPHTPSMAARFQTIAGIGKKELITDAINNTKTARDKAVDNAHKALVDAFGPKLNSMIVEKLSTSEDGITEMDLDELIAELEGAPEDDAMVQECKKRLNEAKDPSVPSSEKEKMYRDIHRKFWAYVQSLPEKSVSLERPQTETDVVVKKFMSGDWKSGIQWISHEGSMIICSLISVSDSDGAWINLSQLPEADKEIILKIAKKPANGLWAKFDQYKNFECSVEGGTDNRKVEFTLGNRVASIPPNEATGRGSDVKVERKGKDILIGDRIKLEKSRIQNLVSPTDSTNNGANRGLSSPPRQKVAGRNAYEIRADVLEMALEWARSTNEYGKLATDDVIDIAEAFYSFVEHR